MIALIGPSSTGKTISLRLLASVWGSPEESTGLLGDLNLTQNALFALMNESSGYPTILDESSAVPEWSFTSLLYNLPKGREKLRCDSTGRIRDPLRYSGAIFLSGERSLFDQTNENNGLLARLLELTLPWTDNPYHATRLEYGCRMNYGTAVVPLMEWLLEHKEELPEMFMTQYLALKQRIPGSNGVEDRILKSYALILTSAYVVVASLALPLDIANIQTLLLQVHEANERVQNTPERMFEKLKARLLDSIGNFPKENEPYASKIWGERGKYKGKAAWWISAETYDEILRDISGANTNEINKIFFEHGWLVRTADRHYKIKHKIGGIQKLCYVLFVDADPATDNTKKSNCRLICKKNTGENTKANTDENVSPNRAYLLSEEEEE